MRERGSGLGNAVHDLFRRANLSLRPAMEITDNEARKRAAVEGLGVAVLSTEAVRSELAVGLLVPLMVEAFPLRSTWHAVWLAGRKLPAAADAFREFITVASWFHPPAR